MGLPPGARAFMVPAGTGSKRSCLSSATRFCWCSPPAESLLLAGVASRQRSQSGRGIKPCEASPLSTRPPLLRLPVVGRERHARRDRKEGRNAAKSLSGNCGQISPAQLRRQHGNGGTARATSDGINFENGASFAVCGLFSGGVIRRGGCFGYFGVGSLRVQGGWSIRGLAMTRGRRSWGRKDGGKGEVSPRAWVPMFGMAVGCY